MYVDSLRNKYPSVQSKVRTNHSSMYLPMWTHCAVLPRIAMEIQKCKKAYLDLDSKEWCKILEYQIKTVVKLNWECSKKMMPIYSQCLRFSVDCISRLYCYTYLIVFCFVFLNFELLQIRVIDDKNQQENRHTVVIKTLQTVTE